MLNRLKLLNPLTRTEYEQYLLFTFNTASWIHKVIDERGAVHAALEEFQIDGYVYILTGGTDCDHQDYQYGPTKMKATLIAWNAMQRDLHQQAEGPVYAFIVPHTDLDTYRR